MEKGCDEDLRRVRRYDMFLAQMDCRRRHAHLDEVDDTPVEKTNEKPNTSTYQLDQSMIIGNSCSEETTSPPTCSGGEDGTIVEDSTTEGFIGQQYIIEGRHGPIIGYKSPNSQGTKLKNSRFQRFVAAKQHRRERALKSSGTISAACKDLGDNLGTPVNHQKESGELDVILCSSNESPNPGVESSSSPELERKHEFGGQDLSSLTHPISSLSDSPTTVTEIPEAQLFLDSSCSSEVPRLGNKTQKYLFIRVESKLYRKGAMKQVGNHESQKRTNKLTWWDDQANKHKYIDLKSDASCDVNDDLECFCCIDRIQELSLGGMDANAHRKNSQNDTPIVELLQEEESFIADGLLSDCASIREWLDNIVGKLFGSVSGKNVSPIHKVAAKSELHSSLNIDDRTVIPRAQEREATHISRDDSSLCDSEATSPTSNASLCASCI